ncbi:MAG: asparaginase [Actinomycetota bacterium]|jgi:L-asparaginase II|nr:asparaginase [Actinomycetota bacterium]
MAAGPANPVLAEVVRSGFTESVHRGSLVVLGPGGEPAMAAGAIDRPMFPRSSNKPMQAAGMLRAGLDLPDRLLALASASHSGEDFHIAGVREILAGAGLTEDDLQCPPDLPLNSAARAAMVRSGSPADRIHMNCSGKHAGMLAACVAAGWPTASYRDPEHPLQRLIRQVVEGLAGEPVTAVGVDGCGAPLMALTPVGLARAFRAVVVAEPGSPERRVADAMRAHPLIMSGTGRSDATLMTAVPGLLMKGGAEGVCAFALPDGRAAAVKIDDGNARAVPVVMAAVLRDLAADLPGTDLAALDRLAAEPVLGAGQPVGEIRPVLG